MHEMSLAESIVQIVDEHADAQGIGQVQAVTLEIGELAGVEVEALRFCFSAVTRATRLADAELHIVSAPGSGWCLACSEAVAISELFAACPRCGSHQVQANGGTQMRVKEFFGV